MLRLKDIYSLLDVSFHSYPILCRMHGFLSVIPFFKDAILFIEGCLGFLGCRLREFQGSFFGHLPEFFQ